MAPVLPVIAAAVAAVVVGRLGWGALLAAVGADAPPRGGPGGSSAPALLTAFALVSSVLFALADLGTFSAGGLTGSIAAVGAASAMAAWRRGTLRTTLASLPSDLGAAAAIAALALAIGSLLPPVDTTLAGSDSSVFLAASRVLADRGRLVHEDELVAGMKTGERAQLFRNRFAGDNTGAYARFPGGVMLVSPEHSLVGFYFYHLFPAWLAGARLLAGESFLGAMALFAAISLGSLWRTGRQLLGAAGALAAPALLACFHPQAYFTRFPLSELLGQALFLGGLLALVLGLAREERERLAHVVLGSLLWGALGLCRVDALPLLWLGLATASLLFWGVYSGAIGPLNWLMDGLNDLGTRLGLVTQTSQISFLGSPNTALLSTTLLIVWKYAGFYMLILLVGLQGIPPELYEAAAIDGAGRWQTFRSITVPLLRPSIALSLILCITGSLLAFDQFYILTKGGPDNTTVTVVQLIYREAFTRHNLGTAAAVSIVVLVALLVLNALQFRGLHGAEAD